MSKPLIFLSAVSKELSTAREAVAQVLRKIGYDVDYLPEFPTEQGDIREMLCRRIEPCEGVIQLVGKRYGFEPPDDSPPHGRVSYTQFEALHGRSVKKKVWYLLLDISFPTDPCDPETSELADLQKAYRQRINKDTHVYHDIPDTNALKLKVHEMKDELAELRKEAKASQELQHRKLDSLGEGQAEMMQQINQLLASTTGAPSQFSRIVRAFVRLPEVLGQIPSTTGKTDDPERYTTAYARLEREEALPFGTLDKGLPGFAQWLRDRPDLDPLIKVQASYVGRNYAEAETNALAAERTFAVLEYETRQRRIQALQLAYQSAQALIQYPRALEHCRAATALTSKERDVLQWLVIQNAIGYLYYLMGRYPESLAHTKAVWQIAQQAGKPEAPAVVAAHMSYASSLEYNGKAAEAEPELRAVLKLRERVLGAEAPDTLTVRNNLANALYSQTKYVEVEQEHQTVLKIRERVLGAEHPSTLMTRMNLANALNAQAKYFDAEQEHRAVLQIKERVLGAEHPETLSSRMNLANALYSQDKDAEAEQEYQAVLQIQERVLGADHPKTLSSRSNLAAALHAQNRHANAEQENRTVLKIQERVLGAEHPEVATSCYNLALCLEAQQKLPEALKFMQRAEQMATNILGSDHPNTKRAKAARERIEAALKTQ